MVKYIVQGYLLLNQLDKFQIISVIPTRLKILKVKLHKNDVLKDYYSRILYEYESYGIIKKVDHIAEPGEVH